MVLTIASYYHSWKSFPKWLLSAPLSTRRSPVAFCPSRRVSKISKWVWPKLFSSYRFCTWTWNLLRFCIHPFRVKFVSYSPLALLKISPSGFQSQMFWGLIFPVQDPWAAESQIPQSLGRTSAVVLIPSICGSPSQGFVLTILHFWPPAHFVVVSLLCL